MDLYRFSPFIAYEHEQGMFIFDLLGGGQKEIPIHFISEVKVEENSVRIICDTKYRKDTFLVESENTEHDVEELLWLLDEFG